MWQAFLDNVKAIGIAISALTASASGYVYFDGPVPASRQYVVAQAQTLKHDLVDNRLQINTMQRQLLRKEKFDRELDIKKASDSGTTQIIQERLNSITDEMDGIERERESLLKEKQK